MLHLVTGGAGFLGSHLCNALVDGGDRVVIIDNLLTGHVRNLEHAVSSGRATFVFGDVAAGPKEIATLLHDALAGKRVERIWHLASPASPDAYGKHPWETLAVNGYATMALIEFALAHDSRFLYTSTSEIYGDPLVHPQKEDYWGNVNTIGPRGCYDEAKRFAEALTMAYHREHRVETRIVRIFNTYGPRMRLNDGRVVPAFISQALKNKPVTVFGKGQQTRSFCYVSDLIEGIYRLMMSNHDLPVNIGNPTEMTMLQFAEQIIRATRSRSKIVFKPLPQDDPKQRKPDITKANRILKWEPKVPLAAGLKQTIKYFRKKV